MKKLFLSFLFLAATSSHAALFQGDSTGIFVNPTGPGGMVTTGAGTSSFTWGGGSNTSSLDYTGASFDVDENIDFIFGTLDYYNGTIPLGTQADAVDLSVNLDLTAPSAISENFVFDLSLINTPNNTGTAAGDADIVNFDNTVPSNSFSYAGVDYTLEFLGFGTLTGSGFTIADSFNVYENDSASVNLVGRITSSVPEPSTLLLLGLGIVTVVSVSKNRKRVSLD